MDNFDKELGSAFEDAGHFNADKNGALRNQLIRTFDDKLKMVRFITWIFVIFFVGLFLWGLWMVILGQSNKLMFVGLALIIIASGGDTLIKLWYWQVHSRITITKELKKIEFQIADLSSREHAEKE